MIFVVFLSGSIRHYFPSPGRHSGTVLAHITGVSPLRGSLRAAPIACVCGWAGVSLCSDGVIAKQLARAVLGWMGTAGHLIWPFFIRVFSAQVVLAHPPYRFPFLTRTVRERIPVAGYDRRARCFSKSTRGCFALSSLYHNLQSLKPTLFFQKFQNKFFKGFFPPLNSPITETVFFA